MKKSNFLYNTKDIFKNTQINSLQIFQKWIFGDISQITSLYFYRQSYLPCKEESEYEAEKTNCDNKINSFIL